MMTRLSHKRNVGRKWATNSVERIHITLNVYKTRNWLLPLRKRNRETGTGISSATFMIWSFAIYISVLSPKQMIDNSDGRLCYVSLVCL